MGVGALAVEKEKLCAQAARNTVRREWGLTKWGGITRGCSAKENVTQRM